MQCVATPEIRPHYPFFESATKCATEFYIFVVAKGLIMAKYSVKDFVEAYGQKEGTVKSWVHRGKLQKDAEGLIDTENPVNRLLISEMQLKVNANLISGKSKKQSPKQESKSESPKEVPLNNSQKAYADIDYRTKVATAEAKEREAELKRIQLEKIAGKLMPVEVVEKICVINNQGIFKTFFNDLENMASTICGNDRTRLAMVTEQLAIDLQRCVEKAGEDTLFEIEIAVNEYQEVRSRGERK